MGEKQGHTPGPWSHDYRKNRNGGYSQEVFDQNGELIATAAWYPVKFDDVTTTTNREANARLIASAPDLLTALNDILPPTLCGESWDLPDHDAVPITITFGKLRAARAAISRATGEDSPANSQPEDSRA